MNEKKLLCEIYTPDKKVFSKDVWMVVVKGVEGELGILPGHAPLVTALVPCKVRIKYDETNQEIIRIYGGFMEVLHNRVTIYTLNTDSSEGKNFSELLEKYRQENEEIWEKEVSKK